MSLLPERKERGANFGLLRMGVKCRLRMVERINVARLVKLMFLKVRIWNSIL